MTEIVKKPQDNEKIMSLPDIEVKTIFGDCNLRSYIGHNLVLFFYPREKGMRDNLDKAHVRSTSA